MAWANPGIKNESYTYNYLNQLLSKDDVFLQTEKSNVYQLGAKLLKINSKVYDSTNVYAPFTDNFTDYFYYSHDGAVAERHDDVGTLKYFTRNRYVFATAPPESQPGHRINAR